MSKTIKVDFSYEGLGKLIDELKAYKDGLNDKTEELARRLAEVGIPVVNQNMSAAGYTYDEKGVESGSDTSHNTYVTMHSFGNYSEAILTVEGKDILFIEFGSGVHYNGAAGSSPHPKGGEFGYTIGSYGKGYGKKDTWAYEAESGEKVLTHGTQATMPMYKASNEIARNVVKIAQEVFGRS